MRKRFYGKSFVSLAPFCLALMLILSACGSKPPASATNSGTTNGATPAESSGQTETSQEESSSSQENKDTNGLHEYTVGGEFKLYCKTDIDALIDDQGAVDLSIIATQLGWHYNEKPEFAEKVLRASFFKDDKNLYEISLTESNGDYFSAIFYTTLYGPNMDGGVSLGSNTIRFPEDSDDKTVTLKLVKSNGESFYYDNFIRKDLLVVYVYLLENQDPNKGDGYFDALEAILPNVID